MGAWQPDAWTAALRATGSDSWAVRRSKAECDAICAAQPRLARVGLRPWPARRRHQPTEGIHCGRHGSLPGGVREGIDYISYQ